MRCALYADGYWQTATPHACVIRIRPLLPDERERTQAAAAELTRVKQELTRVFGGVTDFRHRSDGTWRIGGVTFHDEIVLLRVLGDDRDKGRRFLQALARELKASLAQEEILIVERDVMALGTH